MNGSHTQLKALVLMLVLVLGITVFERADTIAQYLDNERNTANIFNPVANFLGIPIGGSSGSSNYNSLNPSGQGGSANNDGDVGFDSIPLNSPSPTNAVNNDLTGAASSGGGTASTSGSIRGAAPTFLCLPKVVDGGEEAIVMWACRDGAYKATASGFETGDETIGSVRVNPSTDTTYALTCVNDVAGVDNTTGECTVEVANPALALIATPSRTSRGGTVTLSWKTKDTNSCVVTSDQHPSFERRGTEGDALSPSLISNTVFTLTCETVTGVVEERSITVGVN